MSDMEIELWHVKLKRRRAGGVVASVDAEGGIELGLSKAQR